MSDLTLVSSSEFKTLSIESDWNTEIAQKVPKFGFFLKRKDEFSPKTCMISVNVETFFI